MRPVNEDGHLLKLGIMTPTIRPLIRRGEHSQKHERSSHILIILLILLLLILILILIIEWGKISVSPFMNVFVDAIINRL